MRTRVKDVVIILPGISGSVLAKDGKEIWGLSGQALWAALRTLGGSLELLRLDSTTRYGEDGITATSVIHDAHLIPGLSKIDGYTALVKSLRNSLDLKLGSEGQARNYWEFPYDWRRDNRETAQLFQRFAEQILAQWKNWSGASDARLIIIAHSMGGLVARYFLDVLGGWNICRT
jgi:hypothetical protein